MDLRRSMVQVSRTLLERVLPYNTNLAAGYWDRKELGQSLCINFTQQQKTAVAQGLVMARLGMVYPAHDGQGRILVMRPTKDVRDQVRMQRC